MWSRMVGLFVSDSSPWSDEGLFRERARMSGEVGGGLIFWRWRMHYAADRCQILLHYSHTCGLTFGILTSSEFPDLLSRHRHLSTNRSNAHLYSLTIFSAASSAIPYTIVWRCPLGRTGITLASTTRNPWTHRPSHLHRLRHHPLWVAWRTFPEDGRSRALYSSRKPPSPPLYLWLGDQARTPRSRIL